MLDFKSCNTEKQITILLDLAKKLWPHFSKEEYKSFAQHVIVICEEWNNSKKISPDDIYKFIDGGENEDISIIQEDSEGYDTDLWDCYIYIVAYINKIAYEYDKQIYVPQIIETVDDSCYQKVMDICKNITILPPDFFS